MQVLGVIPARYGSTRFPGKALADIGGKTLIERVWERANQARRLDRVVVATDDERILKQVESFGGRALMTSQQHASGTDRLGEVAGKLPAELYVNIQGDEPLLPAAALDALIARVELTSAPMGTLVSRLPAALNSQVFEDPNVVKAVVDAKGYALYFSRSQIPYPRNATEFFFRHVGVYVYTAPTLELLCATPACDLERSESLEQLRALHLGIRIITAQTDYDPLGVDVPTDVAAVLSRLNLERS